MATTCHHLKFTRQTILCWAFQFCLKNHQWQRSCLTSSFWRKLERLHPLHSLPLILKALHWLQARKVVWTSWQKIKPHSRQSSQSFKDHSRQHLASLQPLWAAVGASFRARPHSLEHSLPAELPPLVALPCVPKRASFSSLLRGQSELFLPL